MIPAVPAPVPVLARLGQQAAGMGPVPNAGV